MDSQIGVDSAEAYLWLLPSVQVGYAHSSVTCYAGKHAIEFSGLGRKALTFIQCLDGELKAAQVWKSALAPLILPVLHSKGWIVQLERSLRSTEIRWPSGARQLAYFAHHSPIFPDRVFEILRNRSALIMGAGGIGSHAAFGLAASGIGKLYVFDPDKIEASNLNRQFLYTRGVIGDYKVDVLKAQLLARFPRTQIIAHRKSFDECTRIPNADLALICCEVGRPFQRPAELRDRIVIPAGYFGSTAVVGPVCNGKYGICWQCFVRHARRLAGTMGSAPSINSKSYHPKAANPSGYSINAIAGAIVADEATRALSPEFCPPLLQQSRLYVHMDSLRISSESVAPMRCPH